MKIHAHQDSVQTEITQLTDACVACGMCLPGCPTYQQSRTEAESPRGRISLVRALVTGQLQATEKMLEHLDACMMCRTCERICPAQVEFGKIMDNARYYLQVSEQSRLHSMEKIMLSMLDDAAQIKTRFSLLQKIDLLHLRRPATFVLKQIASDQGKILEQLPVIKSKEDLKNYYPARGESRDRIMLFTGCVARYVDLHTIHAAIRLLNRLGYDVVIPEGQQCCGAVHQHAGQQEKAQELLARNQEQFSKNSTDRIVSLATGCSAHLHEQAVNENNNSFPGRVIDICDFLARDHALNELHFAERQQKIILHIPCTQRNVLRQENSVRKLLALIPGMDVHEIPASVSCCGAAGTYMFTHPEEANRQREQILGEITQQQEEILLSSNIGCVMHIARGLAQKGAMTRILHPVQLLVESIISGEKS